jgi:peptidoglycan/xylan/chitin deacetylase (PgdA/CDA1 family)
MSRFMMRVRLLLVSLALLALVAGGPGAAGLARAADPVTIWAGNPSQKAVALTFDDGPSPIYTPEILALLRHYHAQATFFVLGERVEKYPGLIRAMLRDGHEVGNHSFDHDRLTKLSRPGWQGEMKELERTQMDLEVLGCPRRGQLMRPPYSAFDERLVAYLKHTHRGLVLWNVDSGDWQGLDAQAIEHNVLDRVKNGSIVVFHDCDENGCKDRRPTVEALKVILPTLEKAGYRLVTISELVSRQPR